ncbi:carbon monoxide dehydrogenase subunit G, partial [Streptomyces albidoflavus]
MEHEVFVPVPAEALRVALRAPATAVRGVPGLQLDPAAEGGADGAACARTGRRGRRGVVVPPPGGGPPGRAHPTGRGVVVVV